GRLSHAPVTPGPGGARRNLRQVRPQFPLRSWATASYSADAPSTGREQVEAEPSSRYAQAEGRSGRWTKATPGSANSWSGMVRLSGVEGASGGGEEGGGALGEPPHQVRVPVGPVRGGDQHAVTLSDELELELRPHAIQHLELHPVRPRAERERL